MSKLKTVFTTEENTAYPKTKIILSIIGKVPGDKPYLSITTQQNQSEIVMGWLADKDLERFAVNILKALKSKKLKQ